ncbi:MAG: MmcQ/YjbR family DNA-binding protein [Candidatus Tumulicola sp.]
MATWRDVSRYALALPETIEERSTDGLRRWAVKKKLFAWERPLRRSDLLALGDDAPAGPILGLRTADLEMKEMMLASDPAVYFTTPHFNGYPAVLVRLKAIAPKDLKDAVVEAWLTRAPARLAAQYLG